MAKIVTKFDPRSLGDSEYTGSDEASCCDSQQSCLNKGCAELDITMSSEESLSFSVDDDADTDGPFFSDKRSRLALTASATGANGVGSPLFRNFNLCFEERELLKQQRTIQHWSNATSWASQRQLLQPQTTIQGLSITRKNPAFKAVSLPQLLWQPEAGLCCHPGMNTNAFRDEELILFEDETVKDSQDEHGSLLLNEDALLLQPESPRSSVEEYDILDGGTREDPRYVPRPSSTSPSLRNMSQFFRNMYNPEDALKADVGWENDIEVNDSPPNHQRDISDLQVLDLSTAKEELQGTSAAELATPSKSATRMTTPSLGHILQRRSRSEITSPAAVSEPGLTPTSASGTYTGPWLQRSRTEDSIRSHHRNEDGGKKGKNALMNFFRRTRLPALRKGQFSQRSLQKDAQNGLKENTVGRGEDAMVDAANILASLEETLKQQHGGNGPTGRIQESLPHKCERQEGGKGGKSSSNLVLSAQNSEKKFQALPTQGSGETQSDASSLFGDIHSDDDSGSCCSEEDSHNVDLFFETPYFKNQDRWRKEQSRANKSRFGQRHRHYNALGVGKQGHGKPHSAKMSSKSEFTRCGSVDTAKASNRSGDPWADRARLLEIQAYLVQQQKERERRLNAPPMEFVAPDGDNVIRVREAACDSIDDACEIEVLPKNGGGRSALPPTAAEF